MIWEKSSCSGAFCAFCCYRSGGVGAVGSYEGLHSLRMRFFLYTTVSSIIISSWTKKWSVHCCSTMPLAIHVFMAYCQMKSESINLLSSYYYSHSLYDIFMQMSKTVLASLSASYFTHFGALLCTCLSLDSDICSQLLISSFSYLLQNYFYELFVASLWLVA